jgi:DNA-binding XRE family transcriptional regulator
MNIAKYYWDLNKNALKQTRKILRTPGHPKFVSRAVTLLSRCDKPRELFSFFTTKEFIAFWPRVKVYWLKVVRESDFRDWWQTIYEQLLRQQGRKLKEPKSDQSILASNLGKAIREARVQKGLSQKELASLAGIKQPDISKIEDGKKNITLKTLAALSGALKIKKIFLEK